MVTISLCMIVKNEEDVLDRCLAPVKDLVDEVVIVDTGSTDRTKEIASQYTELIYGFQWIDDFSAARNFAFSKASMDFCMWLDADDVIEDGDRERFRQLKQSLTADIDIVMMRYNTGFDGNGFPSFWYYRERLIRNNGTHIWQGTVHEVITPSGVIVYSEAAVSHRKLHGGDPDRNLNIYRKMISAGNVLNAREQYYYARELYYHEMYGEALDVLDRFLNLEEGWIENKIEACIMMSECCKRMDKKTLCLRILFRSLEYDAPRAEVCCEVGNCFIEEGLYEVAAFWFKTALNCKKNFRQGGFILTDCYDYIPMLQLCVCCDRMGYLKEAKEYNDQAGSIKPDSPSYLHNKAYFEKILG